MMSTTNRTFDPKRADAEDKLQDRRFDSLRSLVRRRLLVIVTVATFATTIGMGLADRYWWFFLGVLPSLALAGLVRAVVRSIADLPSEYIDERFEQVRNLAFKRAYGIFFGLITLTCLVVMLVVRLDSPVTLGNDQLTAVFWATFLVGGSLPSLILAWTEPEI